MMGTMVAQPLNYLPLDPPAPAAPSPPPHGRHRGRTMIAVVLFVVGTLGGAAVGAAAVISRTPATSATTATASSASSTSSAASAAATSVAALYQQAVQGVVTISTEIATRFGGSGQGIGSGIVVDQNGDILTNAHVVSGASQVQVTFSDGRTVSASIIGVNSSADLAVVRVSVAASRLHPLTLGDSSTVHVGDTVYAIGAPFGLSESLTSGIVSGLNRSNPGSGLSGLIQTDAAINPGNSGGALLNSAGQVIGINDSIESPVEGNVGVGFAIPINTIRQLLPSLEGGANQ